MRLGMAECRVPCLVPLTQTLTSDLVFRIIMPEAYLLYKSEAGIPNLV